jgi:hypothetical protein
LSIFMTVSTCNAASIWRATQTILHSDNLRRIDALGIEYLSTRCGSFAGSPSARPCIARILPNRPKPRSGAP